MNARASENYLAISRSSSASKSVEIFCAEIYWERLFFRAESSLIQSSCRSFIGVIVPYEISKVNFHVETKNLVSMSEIKVITKLPNSEQSYKGKVKTHNYINRQNQSTTGKL